MGQLSEQKAIDYSMSVDDSKELLGTVLLTHEFRQVILRKYVEKHGPEALVNLFSQFIGLANSVVTNSHESLEIFLICEKGWHERDAEKWNFPTIFGALSGVKLAEGVNQQKTCAGCACRLGSPANQSPATTCDFDWALTGDDRFWCHEDLDEKENPTKPCIGFQTHRQSVPSEARE